MESRQVTLVSYWWGNYENKAKDFEKTCKKYGIQYDIEHIEKFNKRNYQLNINYKPRFIKKMIKKHNTNVVYMDIDMKICKYPKLFEYLSEKNVDYSGYNWNGDIRAYKNYDPMVYETSGGIMYFGNTKNGKKILELWKNKLNERKYRKSADDRILAMVIDENKCIEWCKLFWMPFEYFYIEEFYKDCIKEEDVVIKHNSKVTSEEAVYKKCGVENRIPEEYNKIEKKINYERNIYINEKILPETMKNMIKKLKASKYKKNFEKRRGAIDIYKKLLKE